MTFMCSDELYHYGVKGMKWGVRKERYTSGRRIGAYDPDDPQSRKDYRRLNAALAIGAGAGALYGMYKRRSFNPNDNRKFVRVLRTASPVITGAAGAIGAGGVAAGYSQLRDKIISNARQKNRAGAYRTLSDGRIGKTNWAPNYSESQRAEDRRVYSRGAVRRINKRLLNGETIKGSRSAEADRIHRYRSASNIAGKIGSAVGTVAGGAGAYYLSRKFGHGSLRDPIAVGAASMGAGIGNAVGRSIGGRGTMILGGYGRKRRR